MAQNSMRPSDLNHSRSANYLTPVP